MKRLFCAAAALALLCSCETKEQEASRLEGEKIAPDNVIKYVEEKYGFTPQLKSLVTDSYVGKAGLSYTDHVIAEMTHEGRDFIVYSAFDGSDACDDLQQEEIQTALENEVKSHIPEAKQVEICQYPNIRLEKYTGKEIKLYREYFDGQDLSSVLYESRLVVCAVNADLSGNFDWFDKLTHPNKESCIVSYRSQEALTEKADLAEGFTYGDTPKRLKNSLYIEECRVSQGLHEEYVFAEADWLTYVACDSSGAPADLHVENTDEKHYTFTVPEGGCAELFLPKYCDTMRFYDNSHQFTTHLEEDYLQADISFEEGKHTLVIIE